MPFGSSAVMSSVAGEKRKSENDEGQTSQGMEKFIKHKHGHDEVSDFEVAAAARDQDLVLRMSLQRFHSNESSPEDKLKCRRFIVRHTSAHSAIMRKTRNWKAYNSSKGEGNQNVLDYLPIDTVFKEISDLQACLKWNYTVAEPTPEENQMFAYVIEALASLNVDVQTTEEDFTGILFESETLSSSEIGNIKKVINDCIMEMENKVKKTLSFKRHEIQMQEMEICPKNLVEFAKQFLQDLRLFFGIPQKTELAFQELFASLCMACGLKMWSGGHIKARSASIYGIPVKSVPDLRAFSVTPNMPKLSDGTLVNPSPKVLALAEVKVAERQKWGNSPEYDECYAQLRGMLGQALGEAIVECLDTEPPKVTNKHMILFAVQSTKVQILLLLLPAAVKTFLKESACPQEEYTYNGIRGNILYTRSLNYLIEEERHTLMNILRTIALIRDVD